jgi:hypothetical protein
MNMLRGVLITIAIVVYVISVGCGVGSDTRPDRDQASSRPPATTSIAQLSGLPYRGVVMQIQRTDWIDKYEKSIDDIAALGADTVKLVVDARQENGGSSAIWLDVRSTPTPEALQRLIRHAKSKNLRVIVMPIVLLEKPRDNEWRGTIRPESWADWWDSYRQMINHFAWISQGAGADVFVVGSELVSTETETHLPQWRRTIAEVRKVFTGRLTYSSNWDHYTHVKFWDDLDLIGMNSYWKLGEDRNVSVPEIVKRWHDIQGELFRFQQTVGKPLILLEVGWCNMANMAHQPWDYTLSDSEAPTDNELQVKLYEGFFRAWHGRPELGGFCIWEWHPKDESDDKVDRTYTPQGKPAESVLREWLAKPWGSQ